MPAVAAELTSDQDVREYLDAVVSICEAGDFTRELEDWSDRAQGKLGQYMQQSKSPDGKPYAPLSPKTIAKRENKLGPPLINLGDLFLSLVGEGEGSIRMVGAMSVTLGTGHHKFNEESGKYVPVAVIQHFGARNDDGSVIPPRPFVGVSEEMADEAVEIIGAGLAAKADRL